MEIKINLEIDLDIDVAIEHLLVLLKNSNIEYVYVWKEARELIYIIYYLSSLSSYKGIAWESLSLLRDHVI